MGLDHASATDLLDRFVQAREAFDGDAWTELFTDDVEYREDPFEPPLVGKKAVRAYLNEAAERQEQVAFTVERHWVVDPTILLAFHAGYVQRSDRARVQVAGFMTLEISGGRIARLREWYHRRATDAAG
jgi:ketosteroid isomerase-like protein